ncbi:hypothetical protein N9J50_01220 [Methylophilaceae bacterium]|jgi:hypothetical protein|nr:hypothetical protein [Methylophilaceae bacterium]
MNKFIKASFILITSLSFSMPTLAGEITDMEWNFLQQLIVTYYKSGGAGQVNCTAWNQERKAIGGGSGFYSGNIARVSITTPTKYVGKNLSVSCK